MILLNNVEIKPTMFPDKTSQIWKVGNIYSHIKQIIMWDFENEGEFLHLAQLVDLLRSRPNSDQIELTIPYLPYGRQDKDINNEETFALRTFANLLNSLKIQKISSLDVHNENLTKKLINNFNSISPSRFIANALQATMAHLICFPDAGAAKRYFVDLLHHSKPYVIGHKVRNQSTGHITDYSVVGDVKDKEVLIVDDICDGGMTFIILAEKLKKMGASQVHLYVTHGIFSKGIDVLYNAGISRIFTHKGEVI